MNGSGAIIHRLKESLEDGEKKTMKKREDKTTM